MLDHRIILAGQTPDYATAITNGVTGGLDLANTLIGSQVNRMRDIDNANERKAFANNHFLGRQLRAQLKQDDAAAYQAQLTQQKALSEISKTESESFKNNAQGQGYGLDNAKQLMQNANQALMTAAQTGDPMAAKLALNNARKAGAIDDDVFYQYSQQIDALGTNPDALRQFAQSIVFAGAKDPASLLYTSADNRLDNDTSRQNAQLSAETSRYGTDVNAETQRQKIAQDQAQFDAEAYIKQNKPIDYFTAADGTRYAVYANGQGIPISNPQGEVIKAQQTGQKGQTATQQFEQREKAIAYRDAAINAEEAAALARTLANDVNGLSKTTGGFGIMAKIPGTDARDYAQRVETLKSQVFLTQVEKMKGMGALTDAEGARLEKSIASLDINLGEDQFKQNLIEIERVLSRAANSARERASLYGGETSQPSTAPNQAKGATTSLADVKAAAKQAGLSVDEMVNILQRQGVRVQ